MVMGIISNKINPLKTAKWNLFKYFAAVLFVVGFTVNSNAQCGPYQYYEGIQASALVTAGWTMGSGGSWSFPNTSGAAPRSGSTCILQNAAPAAANTTWILSPKINTPKTVSFWIKTSAVVPYSIAFSDDNKSTWINIADGTNTVSTVLNPTPYSITASLPATTTAWQLVTLTASFPASANGYYFKISDNRASGTASLWIDDISWVSSVDAENTIVAPQVGTTTGTAIVPPGAVFRFYDVGGKNDLYSNGQTNTVTFTPANPGDKIKVTFMGFFMADGNDKIFIYDSNGTVLNQITGSPFSSASASFPTYTSSLSADGSITIKFVSNGAYANAAIGSMSDGFDLKIECTASICPLPTVTPTMTNITSTTATLNWSGIAAGYEYLITNAATAPTVAGTYTTATSVNLTGLTPNTYYCGWVRSRCSPTFFSSWIRTDWFQTPCAPTVLPYVEDLNGFDYSLPGCTTSDPDGDWQTSLVDNYMFATIAAYSFYSKPVALAAATVYNLSYDFFALNGTADFDVYIGTVNDPTILIPANKLVSHTNVGGLTHYSLNFTPSVAGNYYIAFYLASTSVPLTTKLVIDDFMLDCVTPVISASTNSVCSSNEIITLSGAGVPGYKWSATAGNFYTDAAATIPYVPLSNAQTIYFRTNYNATITLTSSNGGCDKSVTYNIQVRSTTWNGSAWSNGTPDNNTQAIFNGNYASNNLVTPGNINACSVVVQSGTVLFKSGHSLVIQNALTVAGGSLTFENNASLVQPNNSSNALGVYNGGNSGTINYQRTTMPLTRYDYTYWSSPVNGQTLVALSPLTLFDKYYYFDAALTNYWVAIGNTSVMTPGKGYIVRAPQTFDLAVAQVYNASFTGVPNNGTITTPIVAGNFNLIGNPYPSALNVDTFLNSGLNSGVVEGTIYLWTHNTPLTGNQYAQNDYAVYNYLGGTGTKAAPSGATGGFNNTIPNGKIAAGQSFFIKGLATANATFQNTMRVVGNNTQFFRSNPETAPIVRNNSRIWLDISNNQGAFKQALIGYSQQATLGLDRGYDGEYYDFGSSISLYSLSDATALAIQGRPLPFNKLDEVPLGFNVTASGTYTINLSNFDGLFLNQNIYLKDLVLNTTINLKQNAYTFTTNSGTFNNRFLLVYRATKNTPNEVEIDHEASKIIMFKPDNYLHLDVGNRTIKNIKVFDIRGVLLLEKEEVNASDAILDIEKNNQFLVVEITFSDGEVVAQKYVN
jgi:hypothetical protein